ncbi:GTPase [Actinomyces timonensis]|uniref:GTPase n=1 Tax=Actinomyces timonensis TaxID=1288391 RepID=A0AAU8N1S9_9ACTO
MSGTAPEPARRATRENPAARSLAEALGALRRIIELGDGLGLGEDLDEAREIVARAGARASLAPGRTVIALAGATGSGKSSLLNALAGAPIARTAVTRPTTIRPLALLPGGRADGEASALLGWLGVDERVVAPLAGAVPADAIILDLPDVDSDAPEHRLIAERMAAQVDALVWVLDPEKYADAVLHKDFIAPMAAHAEVTLVVLNQADRLDAASREQVGADLRRLLAREGLAGTAPILASARTGEGIDALRGALERIAQARTASALRLRADARRAATRLRERFGGGGAGAPIDGRRLAEAASRAAGAEVVASAVRAATIHRGALSVGWPPVLWVRRFRADPLAALHLRGASPSRSSRAGEGPRPLDAVARTSLPEPSPVAVGLLRTEAHRLAADASAHLPGTARDAMLQRMDERAEAIGRAARRGHRPRRPGDARPPLVVGRLSPPMARPGRGDRRGRLAGRAVGHAGPAAHRCRATPLGPRALARRPARRRPGRRSPAGGHRRGGRARGRQTARGTGQETPAAGDRRRRRVTAHRAPARRARALGRAGRDGRRPQPARALTGLDRRCPTRVRARL